METESENSNFSFPMGQNRENDHSNPYIESTTVLSDYNINLKADLCRFNHQVPSITSACLMGVLNYYVSHTLSECKRVDQSKVLGHHRNSLALPTHFPSSRFQLMSEGTGSVFFAGSILKIKAVIVSIYLTRTGVITCMLIRIIKRRIYCIMILLL